MARKESAPKTEEKKKTRYRVKNWREYNQALMNRGSLTVWISDDIDETWAAEYRHKGRGHQPVYSDQAIEFMLTIRSLFKIPLRQTTGFVRSLFTMLKLELQVPDYSQVCRRQAGIKMKPINASKAMKAGVDLVMDSTGLKVYGDGEWMTKKHGPSKRRTWRKLHIGIDANSGEIVYAELTTNNEDSGDSKEAVKAMRDLISSGVNIKSFRGDGAYDTHAIYNTGRINGINVIVPPREDAVTLDEKYSNADRFKISWQRDDTIRAVREKSRAEWKKESGYHKRSLVEMTFFRYKTVFGERMAARSFPNQKAEVLLRSRLLNKLNQLGKPVSVPIKT
jgi:hypothetical protein